MSWIAVEMDGTEIICTEKPERIALDNSSDYIYPFYWGYMFGAESGVFGLCDKPQHIITIPNGSIKFWTGKDMTWDDEPIEL